MVQQVLVLVRILKDLDRSVEGKNVLVVEDICRYGHNPSLFIG